MSTAPGFRARVLLERYDGEWDEELARWFTDEARSLLEERFPYARVFVYVEANPPSDEI